MVTMLDSINPWAIPANAAMVAGYVNGAVSVWTPAGWARFAYTPKRRITVTAAEVVGCDTLDVETGDALPWEAPAWVAAVRARGVVDPWVYVQASSWAATQTEFRARGIAMPNWWVADWDGVAEVPAGAIAKQYADGKMLGTGYDASVVLVTAGAGGGSVSNDMTPEEHGWLEGVFNATTQGFTLQRVMAILNDPTNGLAAIKAQLETIQVVSGGGLSAGEHKTLQDVHDAIARIETGLKGA